MSGEKIIDQDMSGIGRARRGSVIAMVGKVLLWMDFLLLAFVYVGLRSGSHMWLYWVTGQGILGFVLVVAGARMRARETAKSPREMKKAA
jgi:hypothetical protein